MSWTLKSLKFEMPFKYVYNKKSEMKKKFFFFFGEGYWRYNYVRKNEH